jgi:tetratricopeptide (TPR) repeat protein
MSSGCFEDPEKSSKLLFVQASNSAQQLSQSGGNYSSMLTHFQKAKAPLDKIHEDYPSADLAIRLLSGEAKIAGMTFQEFNDLGPLLQKLAHAETDPLFAALLIADEVDEDWVKLSITEDVADQLMEQGKMSKVIELAESVGNDAERSTYRYSVIKSLASDGRFVEAQDHLKFLDSKWKNYGLHVLAGEAAKLGNYESSIKLASKIALPAEGVSAFLHAASELHQIGRHEAVEKIDDKVNEMLSQMSDKDKSGLRESFFRYYSIVGRKSEALAVLSEELDVKKRLSLKLRWARRLVENGNTEEAMVLIEDLLSQSDSISDDYDRKDLIGEYAVFLINNGELEKGQSLIEGVNSWDRGMILLALAKRYAKQGDAAKALSIANSARDFTKVVRDRTLAEIVKVHCENDLMEEAKAMADRIESKDYRAKSILDIANRYAEQGNTEAASKAMAESIWMTAKIKSKHSQAEIFTTISKISTENKLQAPNSALAALQVFVNDRYPVESLNL